MINKENIIKISKNVSTPLYIFDIDELKKRICAIKEILGNNIYLCYAIKANPFLINYMQNIIDKYEVCSPGELQICNLEKINTEKIVLSGVNKKNIGSILNSNNIGTYTVESINQLNDFNNVTNNSKKTINVLLRLSSENQFGMDKETIYSIFENKSNYKNLKIIGIQYYSTTQKKNYSDIEDEILMLYEFCNNIQKDFSYTISEIEYGPGLAINYFEPNTENNYDTLIKFSKILEKISKDYKITLEIGRYLVATCGIYLTKIVDLKTNNSQNYCIVDGGINHISYYGQNLGMKIPKLDIIQKQTPSSIVFKYNICGSLCTSNDILVKNLEVSNLSIDDLFVFYNVGAYSVTEALSLFLSRDLPQILIYENDKIDIIRTNIPTSIINSKYINYNN